MRCGAGYGITWETRHVTPDAVIYRYLEIVSAPVLDVDRLFELLCADADLLARWLVLLDIPADASLLRARLIDIPANFTDVAQSHIWSLSASTNVPGLSLNQWSQVLTAACLAETLCTDSHLADKALDCRLKVLLALSGLRINQDDEINDLLDYRGVDPALLEGTDALLRVFAIADGVQTGRAGALAEMLLDIDPTSFEAKLNAATASVTAWCDRLGVNDRDDENWSQRIAVLQQIEAATADFQSAGDWSELWDMHVEASRGVFQSTPLIFLLDSDNTSLVLLDPDRATSVAISVDNRASTFTRLMREGGAERLIDSETLAVVDRQVMRSLGADEVYVVTLENTGLMVFPADDDPEVEYSARVYSNRVLSQSQSQSVSPVDQSSQVEAFRQAEILRLRELVHEANNPLSIVHNYLHILELRLQHEPEAAEQLALIGSELSRAGEIFARARDVPGEQTEDTSVEDAPVEPVNLHQWTHGVIELHSGFAQQRGVNIDAGEMTGEGHIIVDEGRLAQIVGNLVKNAIEACTLGGEVSVGFHDGIMRNARSGAEIQIRDDGPGIPREVLMNLRDTKESAKGGDHQGVGLAVAYRLTGEVGGELDVYSSATTGTIFRLFLPADPPSQ